MKKLFILILFLASCLSVLGVSDESVIVNDVGWTEKLGDHIDLGANITDNNNFT